ncbi:MAG: hypothetical protein HUJ54_09310 [Erysipelotrichaceae bacterium]|nr:hypothetical protein [Erysipelotrichaceae bacterium]
MKKTIAKTAAFAASVLLAFGAAAPVCASEAGTKTQFTVEYIYYEYDNEGLPVWNLDMCDNKVNMYDVQPGRYYIYETNSGMYTPQNPGLCKKHTLIKIEDVFEAERPICGTVRTARYFDTEAKESREMSLCKTVLYVIPAFTCVTATY